MIQFYALIVILFILIIILVAKNRHFKNVNHKMKIEIYDLQEKITLLNQEQNEIKQRYSFAPKDNSRKKQANIEKYQNKAELIKLRESVLLSNLPNFYKFKISLMQQTEQRAFYFLHEILESPQFKKKNYFLFSQVSLSSFVTLTDLTELKRTDDPDFYDMILRSITSKSVDFLICQRYCIKENNNLKFYYSPKLVLEIDGEFHRNMQLSKNEEAFSRIQKNDHFKNQLFKMLNLPLFRISVDYSSEVELADIENILTKNLL